MRSTRLLIAIGVVLLGAGCASLHPNPSARLYMSLPFQDDLTMSKFYLLDRREVQVELGLTRRQVMDVAIVFNADFRKIPGFAEWKTQVQSLSKEEKKQQSDQRMAEMKAIISKWQEMQLSKILKPEQGDRLDALLLQMQGPRAIVTVPGMIGKLGLTPEQTLKIQDTLRQGSDELCPFYQRYGHNMLQSSRRSQTREESNKEQEALIVIITEILKSQDESIMAELTKAQIDQWHKMQGRLLSVSWVETGFYVPFPTAEKVTPSTFEKLRRDK